MARNQRLQRVTAMSVSALLAANALVIAIGLGDDVAPPSEPETVTYIVGEDGTRRAVDPHTPEGSKAIAEAEQRGEQVVTDGESPGTESPRTSSTSTTSTTTTTTTTSTTVVAAEGGPGGPDITILDLDDTLDTVVDTVDQVGNTVDGTVDRVTDIVDDTTDLDTGEILDPLVDGLTDTLTTTVSTVVEVVPTEVLPTVTIPQVTVPPLLPSLPGL